MKTHQCVKMRFKSSDRFRKPKLSIEVIPGSALQKLVLVSSWALVRNRKPTTDLTRNQGSLGVIKSLK